MARKLSTRSQTPVLKREAELRRLRRMVQLYEAALRFVVESDRDRRALSRSGVGTDVTLRGELSAYEDMSRVALRALRRFHPDEPDVESYLKAGTRVPHPPLRIWNVLKRGG